MPNPSADSCAHFPALTISQENFLRKTLFYACNNREPVVHCFTYETERAGRPSGDSGFEGVKPRVSDIVWETFDGLFKTLHRQGRRVEELERRVFELERRLQERAAQAQQMEVVERVAQMPAEKAA